MASSTTDYMTILEDLALHMPLTVLVEASEWVDLLAVDLLVDLQFLADLFRSKRATFS